VFIRIPKVETTAEGRAGRGTLLHEAVYGWKYITARSGLLALLVFLALANFLLEMSVVLFTPMILSFASTATLGLVMSLGGIGYLVGSVVMSIWGCPKHRIHTVMVSMLLMGVFMTLIGLRASLPLVMVSVCLCMFFFPFTVSANQAIWQNRVAPDVQGRVFAIRQAFLQATPLLAYLLTGPLMDKVFEPMLKVGGPLAGSVGQVIGVGAGRGAGLLFICAGLIIVLVSALGYLSRPLRRVEAELPGMTPGNVAARKSRDLGKASREPIAA
jgi:sugar phosphate permease